MMESFDVTKLIEDVLKAYDFKGLIVEAIPFGKGHINQTYCVYTQEDDGTCNRFILQRINTNVFKNPDNLMENIKNVTFYLTKIAKEEETGMTAMELVLTRQGDSYFTAYDGYPWRIYKFVENTVCLQKVENENQFYQAAHAFGTFQYMLRDFPSHTLHETIEKFHDTGDRLDKFMKAVSEDCINRASSVQAEIDFVLNHRDDCFVSMNALREGKLPLRVTHNDTKLNNILMDKDTMTGACVIDLDTVMPGLSINDFGDAIRFGANHSDEDEKDLSLVNFDIDLFEIYTKGYLEGASGSLTNTEIDYLPWGAKLMTLECGIRFLTDYLQGDTYFATHYEGQNLDRCRTQFKLVSDMEKAWQDMNNIIQKYNNLK